MKTDDYSARQLCALLTAALAAPIAASCAAVSWQWVLLAAGAAGVYYIYIVWAAAALPPHVGYDRILCTAFGKTAGSVLLGLYWLWLALSVGGAARLGAGAFPQDQGIPMIPLTLVLIAAQTAAKGRGAVCRFGGLLFLFVAVLMAFTLVFAAGDVQMENLRPAGNSAEAAGPLAVLLLPAAGLFFRDRLKQGDASCVRWYLLVAGLAAAVSLVCVGALGLPLAKASAQPFWLMSRSISVFGIMERFEALISSLLAISICCLIAFFLSAGGKSLQTAVPIIGNWVAVWGGAALGFAAVWLVPCLPGWVWLAGSGIFWGVFPALALGMVRRKKFEK